ncbi:MAG: ATP-binding protein [Bacteroidales bacterium]|nr:ATP-binding protein [Bacteroidales bacterium]
MQTTEEIVLDRFPLGVQSFESLRKRNSIYVDKTDYAYKLANSGTKSFFLARPRRFGKSLMCNTLRAYFEGKKELFEGLKIAKMEKNWTKYPILYLDFVNGNYASGPMMLIYKIQFALKEFEEQNGIQFDDSIFDDNEGSSPKTESEKAKKESQKISIRIQYDLKAVYEKTGLTTVIIVDEYDNPLIKSADIDTDKETYKGFFSVLKSADKYIRFAFLTGVSKFAKTSIFSGINQPKDISIDADFSGICGITHQELTDYFAEYIKDFANKENISVDEMMYQLKKWYDCYLFHEDGVKVFNPVSLFNALQSKDFQNYWYSTGTPTILMQRIKNSFFDIKTLKSDVEYSKDRLKDYKDDEFKTDIVPLLYYTGYLTIKEYVKEERLYILGFPDYEVEMSFFNSLADEFYGSPESENGFDYPKFLGDFRRGDVESVIERLKALYCSIPYANNKNEKLVERDFQNVIYLVFSILGEYIIAEPHFSKGRADSILINKDYVYIFEFKIDQDAQTALNQINVKNYAGKFKMDTRKIFKIGVSFSSTEKNIVDWIAEEE